MSTQKIKCALVSKDNDVVAYLITSPVERIEYEGKNYFLTDTKTVGGWFIYMEPKND